MILPDFGRYQTQAALASSQHIAWETVLHAWGYFSIYSLLFLTAGWWLLRRREL